MSPFIIITTIVIKKIFRDIARLYKFRLLVISLMLAVSVATVYSLAQSQYNLYYTVRYLEHKLNYESFSVHLGTPYVNETAINLTALNGLKAVDYRLELKCKISVFSTDKNYYYYRRGVITGVNVSSQPELTVNSLMVIEGRGFNAEDNHRTVAIAEYHFAKYYNLKVGDNLTVILYDNKSINYDVIGIAVEPEYLIGIGDPEALLPTTLGPYGIIFVPLSQLQNVTNLVGGINKVCILLDSDKNCARAIDTIHRMKLIPNIRYIERRTESYNNIILQKTLQAFELLQLPIILILSVVTGLTVLLSFARLVGDQLHDIGILRTIGMTAFQLLISFFICSLIIGFSASVSGILTGIVLSTVISEYYSTTLELPFIYFKFDLQTCLLTLVFGIIITILATLPALYGITRKYPYNIIYRRYYRIIRTFIITTPIIITKVSNFNLNFTTALWLAFRYIRLSKLRSVATVIGLAIALALPMSVAGLVTSIDHSIKYQFSELERWNALIRFTERLPMTDTLPQISNLTSNVVEPYYSACGKILPYNHTVKLIGIIPDSKAHQFRIISGNRITNQSEILIDTYVAELLNLDLNSKIRINSSYSEAEFTVVGIISEFIKNTCYMLLSDIQKIGENSGNQLISGVYIIGKYQDYHELSKLEYVDEIILKSEFQTQLNRYISKLYPYVNIFVIVGMILGIFTLLTVLFISLNERKLDYALLRAIGSSKYTIFNISLVEFIIYWLSGTVFGLILGYNLASILSSEFTKVAIFKISFYMPFTIGIIWLLFSLAICVICVVILACYCFKLKLVDYLKYENISINLGY